VGNLYANFRIILIYFYNCICVGHLDEVWVNLSFFHNGKAQ
jgi:hypothetical protein